ncbi:MAG: hypothetical protein QOJ06_2385 [Pseudonocardiales bacterium]|nr:hypothetical protein [Pseudonocardiales bacterium]
MGRSSGEPTLPIVSESSADVIIVIERAQDATVIVGAARVEVQRG